MNGYWNVLDRNGESIVCRTRIFVFCMTIIISLTFMSCIPDSEDKSARESCSEDVLSAAFALPNNDIHYEGDYHQEGDGPLGPMSVDGEIIITCKPTNQWPVNSDIELKFTRAKIVDFQGNWLEAKPSDLPPPLKIPEFAFDEYGRAESSYNIGEMPISMLGDLWPLPYEPLKKGDSCRENITSQPREQDYDFYKYEGTRDITFAGIKKIGKNEYPLITVHTVLDVQFDKDTKPVKLTIDSEVFWDTTVNLPLQAKQKVLWEGVVKISESKEEAFSHVMDLSISRRGSR